MVFVNGVVAGMSKACYLCVFTKTSLSFTCIHLGRMFVYCINNNEGGEHCGQRVTSLFIVLTLEKVDLAAIVSVEGDRQLRSFFCQVIVSK